MLENVGNEKTPTGKMAYRTSVAPYNGESLCLTSPGAPAVREVQPRRARASHRRPLSAGASDGPGALPLLHAAALDEYREPRFLVARLELFAELAN